MKLTQAWLGVALGACASGTSAPPTQPAPREPVSIATTQTDKKIAELTPAKLEPGSALDAAITKYYEASATKRTYIMTDKPLYQPGETIWFRADLRATSTLQGGAPVGLTMTLTSPRGSIVAQKRVLAQGGLARNDFKLPDEIDGGEYTLALIADDGTQDQKQLVINTYQAPRLQKTLEMLRKAYGEGDTVAAAIEIKRATGEPFADKDLTGIITIDDAELPRIKLKTDKEGKTTARFALPAKLARGDGLLTIMADDGGVTESVQKRIPIVMKKLDLAVFPEGGDLVDGVPGRVYFMAKTTLGKPADIEGKVIDKKTGATVGEFSSVHDGMGRFELTPATDTQYQVVVTKPVGITTRVDLPMGKPGGCVIRSVDQKSADTLRVGAICNTARKLQVEAVLREKRLASGSFDVGANVPTLVELPIAPHTQGVVQLTLFSSTNEPLSERLVFHGMGSGLQISMTTENKAYSPRDPVKLKIKTTDASGKPVKANIGVAVVDETVLAYADDKSGNLLSRLLLEQELGATKENPIEDPKYYFGDKPDAAAALDALLATRGYRRFEWRPVIEMVKTTKEGAQ